eukprot:411529-Rhodomonas_salina.2
MVLRAPYAMCGTELAYGAAAHKDEDMKKLSVLQVLCSYALLCACYAMSGTRRAYRAVRLISGGQY